MHIYIYINKHTDIHTYIFIYTYRLQATAFGAHDGPARLPVPRVHELKQKPGGPAQADNMQWATCNATTCNGQRDNMQRATAVYNVQCNSMQHAAENMQRATCNATTCKMHNLQNARGNHAAQHMLRPSCHTGTRFRTQGQR